MDNPAAPIGAFILLVGIAELYVAVMLPSLLPRLLARLQPSKPDSIDKPSHEPAGRHPLESVASDPRAMTMMRLSLAASALMAIVFGWHFVTG